MHEITEHHFTSIYDHSNWGSEVGFQVIVPSLLARFYSSNSRGVKICGTGHFNPQDGSIGYNYFANILIHCNAVSGMLAIQHEEISRGFIYGKNLLELDLDEIYGPRPVPAVAPNMTEKCEKLLNDMLEEKVARDLKFQERRTWEKEVAAAKNNEAFADAFVALTKKQKMSNGKGKSSISQQTDKPIHKSNPASPVTKA
ncbi:hypothetical protein C8J56DRAFT_1043004 [Mycena floridula]|nr:hypothetical protein C8J56DRAFT_1043004 [Mycena floridula]